LIDGDQGQIALSGGSWRAALPLANLAKPRLVEVARSASASPADTWLEVDLGAARDIRVVALPKHTISQAGRVRIRGGAAPIGANPGAVAIDTGWVDVWRRVFPSGSLPFGHPSLWDGRLRPEDAAGYPMPVLAVWPTPFIARYWRVDIDDPTNPAGVVDLARLVISPGWQPSLNFGFGARLGWESDTVGEQSLGGARFFDRRPPRRVLSFTLEGLPGDEMLSVAFDLQRSLGVDRQLFFVFDPDDDYHRHRRSFLATLSQTARLDFPYHGRISTAFDLEEVIA
jgi:hypothetical protein